MKNKLKLYGFNNLTKALSFNIYDICYAETPEDQRAYMQYIDEEYDAKRLTQILTDVVNIIGANILNISYQDYDPQGASVSILISEQPVILTADSQNESPGPLNNNNTIVFHLDKSHITVHTYPEMHPVEGIATFRVDIDVSTCGIISPLKALNYLIHKFDSDIVTIDCRIRGFTRDIEGKKLFIDHEINSIQKYLSEDTRNAYKMSDVNVYNENFFHTKMLIKNFHLEKYLFGDATRTLSLSEREKVTDRLKQEMLEIFFGKNF